MNHYSTVPFSWENTPGVSKTTANPPPEEAAEDGHLLPPPPCPPPRNATNRVPIPLPPPRPLKTATRQNHPTPPPCPPPRNANGRVPPPRGLKAAPLARSCSKKAGGLLRKGSEDPFLAAYMECTEQSKKNVGFKKLFSFSSCKRSCDVREDGLMGPKPITIGSRPNHCVGLKAHNYWA